MVTDNTNQADDTTAFLRAARSGNLEKVVEYLDTDLDIDTANSNGLNALHLASKDGHVEIVTELLKRGAKVDSATKKGNTALHIASLAGQAEIVNILLQYGAAVNIQSQNGFTPLYMAAQENHDQVVKILLCSGANQSLATEDGFTPLAVAMQQGHDKVVSVLLENDSKGKVRLPALHIAAKKDDCKAADLLLQNDHKPDVTSKSGFTPLHIAAHYGNEEIARLLIKRGADVNYLAKHNISPLHVAAKWGKNNMVKILLENSATIDAKTRDGLTPLHCAARSGHDQVVATLLENEAPISARTKNGLAPLHMASQGDHVDAARVLLYHRAPVDEVTIDYLTSLHVAAHCGHVRVAKLLLDRKADPNARALNGFTPLHIACKKNRIKVVELLLKHGASIESTTESGLTPLHVASFMGCMNIVIFLLQHEANPDVPTVRGETPLHLAARANQTDIIRILLRNGAKVDARAREQQTPLHIASRLGNVDIVMLLLQHGAAVDTTTKDMYTALHIAAKEGQEEVAAILVDNNASMKAATKNGFTPLHIAAKYGNINVAKILLQKDSSFDVQGKNEITPLHMACHYDHPSVATLLLDKGASPHVASQNGHTALHIAARKNQMDIASTLLEHGADANVESKAGFTPLHMSAQKGHYDMTNLLIEHGADPNHKAKNGLTALHLCAQEDFIRVASILVKNGANIESETESGYRPIHVAAHFGNLSMIRFLLRHNAEIDVRTNQNYTPLHQAAQQGHAHVVSALLEGNASHKARTNDGLTALNIAQKLGYISVMEVLKGLSHDNLTPSNKNWEDKYKVIAPESWHETNFLSDSDDEGGSDTLVGEQPYRYLTADLMKSLRDDSLPIDVTRDDPVHRQVSKEDRQDFVQSNNYCSAENFEMQDSLTLGRLHIRSFLVSFLVDARGGAMKGCRHSGIRIIVPPRRATMPIRVTCRLIKPSKIANPPSLMEGEALATRIIEMGPVAATFLGPVLIDVPHFASVRGKEREIIILRSENGETWKEHDSSSDNDDTLANTPYDSQMSASYSGRITRILTTDFPQYFAIISRIKQEVHVIGAEGGILISSVVDHVQAVFPPGALTKKIKVGLQAHVIPAELTAKLLGNCVAVSPVITIEPRRRKFHKPITLTIPVPQAANKGMINQYGGETPTLRLLCSIAGGTSEAQWEDVTGSTPLTFMNDRVSFTTTVSARFWLMDCRNIGEVPKMATELYKESLFVPFITNFVIYSKRMDLLEATLRILCMTDGKETMHTLERQEEFLEIVKSRDVEALDSKDLYIEFSGNLVPITKSGVQLKFTFKAFRQNRLSFHVKVKDPLLDPVARMLFMREPKVQKGEPPQQPICILNIVLPEIMERARKQEILKNNADFEDSNITTQRIDLYNSEYHKDRKEKSDKPKSAASPSEQKLFRDTLRKEQTDAATIHESLAQKAACPLESVDASYSNKVVAKDDESPVVEKQTYSEKRKFWEDITKKRDDYQRSESEVSRTSQLTINESDSEFVQNVVSEEDTEALSGRSETMEDMNIPDMSECSVAEKAHYFEEQIQKELISVISVPKLVPQDSLKEKDKSANVASERTEEQEMISRTEERVIYLTKEQQDILDEVGGVLKAGDEVELQTKEDLSTRETDTKTMSSVEAEKKIIGDERKHQSSEQFLKTEIQESSEQTSHEKSKRDVEKIVVSEDFAEIKESSKQTSHEKSKRDVEKIEDFTDKVKYEAMHQMMLKETDICQSKTPIEFCREMIEAERRLASQVQEEFLKAEGAYDTSVEKKNIEVTEEERDLTERFEVQADSAKTRDDQSLESSVTEGETTSSLSVEEKVKQLKDEFESYTDSITRDKEDLTVHSNELKKHSMDIIDTVVESTSDKQADARLQKTEEDRKHSEKDSEAQGNKSKLKECEETDSMKESHTKPESRTESTRQAGEESSISHHSTENKTVTSMEDKVCQIRKEFERRISSEMTMEQTIGEDKELRSFDDHRIGKRSEEKKDDTHQRTDPVSIFTKQIIDEESASSTNKVMETEFSRMSAVQKHTSQIKTVEDEKLAQIAATTLPADDAVDKFLAKEITSTSDYSATEMQQDEIKHVKKDFESRIPKHIATAKAEKDRSQKARELENSKIAVTTKSDDLKEDVKKDTDIDKSELTVAEKKKEFDSRIPKRIPDASKSGMESIKNKESESKANVQQMSGGRKDTKMKSSDLKMSEEKLASEKDLKKDFQTREEFETSSFSETKRREEKTSQQYEEHSSKSGSQSQTFSTTFVADPREAFKIFEEMSGANKRAFGTTESKIDLQESTRKEEREVISSEITTGTDTILTLEEKERKEKKKTSESTVTKESPEEKVQEKTSNIKASDTKAEQKTSVNISEDREVIDASGSTTKTESTEKQSFKSLENKDGLVTEASGISRIKESEADVSIQIHKNLTKPETKSGDTYKGKDFHEKSFTSPQHEESIWSKDSKMVTEDIIVQKEMLEKSEKDFKKELMAGEKTKKQQQTVTLIDTKDEAGKKPETQEQISKLIDDKRQQLVKEFEARNIAETIIQSIETEIENRSITTDKDDREYNEQTLTGMKESDSAHDKLADDLTKKFESMMQRTERTHLEASDKGYHVTTEHTEFSHTTLPEGKQDDHFEKGSTRDSISFSEDLTRDEESSPYEKEGSSALESSNIKLQERDITMSPSSVSDQTELDESLDVETNELEDIPKSVPRAQLEKHLQKKTSIPNLAENFFHKESYSEPSCDNTSVQKDFTFSEDSEARVLEIIEPDATPHSRQESTDASSFLIDDHENSKGVTKYQSTFQEIISSHESAGFDPFEKIQDRDITVSPSTVSEQTDLDHSMIQEHSIAGVKRDCETVERRGDSFEIDSPALISPKMKVKDLEIKPVNWMIGDEKIEISENLQPSQAFNKELEEYESIIKQQSLEIATDHDSDYEQEGTRTSDSEKEAVMKESLKKDVVRTTKFTVIPVRDQEFENELVEDKLDVSCQELIDTLQREYDAKTPTEGYTLETREKGTIEKEDEPKTEAKQDTAPLVVQLKESTEKTEETSKYTDGVDATVQAVKTELLKLQDTSKQDISHAESGITVEETFQMGTDSKMMNVSQTMDFQSQDKYLFRPVVSLDMGSKDTEAKTTCSSETITEDVQHARQLPERKPEDKLKKHEEVLPLTMELSKPSIDGEGKLDSTESTRATDKTSGKQQLLTHSTEVITEAKKDQDAKAKTSSIEGIADDVKHAPESLGEKAEEKLKEVKGSLPSEMRASKFSHDDESKHETTESRKGTDITSHKQDQIERSPEGIMETKKLEDVEPKLSYTESVTKDIKHAKLLEGEAEEKLKDRKEELPSQIQIFRSSHDGEDKRQHTETKKTTDITSKKQHKVEHTTVLPDTSALKTKKDDIPSVDLSARYAITVLDQVVKKEIAEVKESLEAAKQDLIEELSENSETVFQIKDSPSEFQFKLQPESIPNELPFLYRAPSADQVSEPEADAITASPIAKPRRNHDELKAVKHEIPIGEKIEDEQCTQTSKTEKEASIETAKGGVKQLSTDNIPDKEKSDISDIPIAVHERREEKDDETTVQPIPIPASRSSSDIETKDDGFVLIPPQPAPRRRHKPARAAKKIKSDSEADVGSSSGESNYQSCDYEIGSGSRPSSSDIEALQSGMPSGTASEYETALMSSEYSTTSRPTSQDYHTAISSLSSRESIKSLNSESSGHLASIESSSEMSETLVASEAELDKEVLDENLECVLEDDHGINVMSASKSSDSPVSEIPTDDAFMQSIDDTPCRMKRSSEMIFQQISEDTGDQEVKLEVEPAERELKTNDTATSTSSTDEPQINIQSVDIMTSRVSEDGIQSVSTQVTTKEEIITTDSSAPCIINKQETTDTQMTSLESDSLGPKLSAMSSVEGDVEGAQGSISSMIHQASMSTSSTSGMSTETVIEKEKQDRRSPDSDSFELVDKPDIIDDFLVIEEVGREAEEFDTEGKSICISAMPCTSIKNYDRDLENLLSEKKEDPDVSTNQTAKPNELFDFESEESPPQASNDDQYSQSYSDDEQYEGGKKWIEMQFHGEGCPYDIEYDRGPLEDIKEEEITDFEAGSSRFGSLGKESIGSVGSMRGSLGSTPDYDVLAGRKYFTKLSDHDTVSLSSLQEFENLESTVAMENARKLQCGSQDSINNGSLPRRYVTSRSGHGDDISLSSLKDFEGLEKACSEAHMIELRAREEEDLLDHESPENRYKLESLARAKAEASAAASFNPSTSGSDDYEKRIKEIDDIIRIAQSNVEKFDRQDDTTEDISQIEITDVEKGGSVNIAGSAGVEGAQRLKEANVMETSTDSLELEDNEDKKHNPLCRSSDSLDMKTTLDFPSLSSDSLNNVRDSRETHLEPVDQFNNARRISSDSLEMPFTEQQEPSLQEGSYESNSNYPERSDVDNAEQTMATATSSTNISKSKPSPNSGA